MNKFGLITDVYFGTDALDRLLALPYHNVFVVADPFAVSSGLIKHVTQRLDQAGISYVIHSDVAPDPSLEKVISGVTAALKCMPECFIALGGGSAMDLTKAIRRFAKQIRPELSQCRLIAIPTTSGTGSEVTSFAVISDPEHNRKYPLVAPDMTPDEAILDAVLVKSVPAKITADTGMDVLTHAIEAYVSVKNNEFSGALAEKAVEICGQFLYRSYNDNNDEHARRKMHVAACLAGMAFNSASLGINHSLAHQLGANFHIPHGRANSILLPYSIEYNSGIRRNSRSQKEYDPCVRKYCNLSRMLGLNSLNEVMMVHALVSYVRFLAQEMGEPMRVSEAVDISADEYLSRVNAMAEAAMQDACTETNPRTPNKEELAEILRSIW